MTHRTSRNGPTYHVIETGRPLAFWLRQQYWTLTYYAVEWQDCPKHSHNGRMAPLGRLLDHTLLPLLHPSLDLIRERGLEPCPNPDTLCRKTA